MDFYSDNNSKRRNLVVLSILIILYFLSGAHIEDGEKLSLPALNLIVSHPKYIYAAVWIMFGWFCFQYFVTSQQFFALMNLYLATPNINYQKGENKAEYLRMFPNGNNNDFITRYKKLCVQLLEKNSPDVLIKLHEFSPALRSSNKSSKVIIAEAEQRAHIQIETILPLVMICNIYNRDVGGNSMLEVFTLTKKESLKVLFLLVRWNGVFSELLLPRILALCAIIFGVYAVLPIHFLLMLLFISVVYLITYEKIDI